MWKSLIINWSRIYYFLIYSFASLDPAYMVGYNNICYKEFTG